MAIKILISGNMYKIKKDRRKLTWSIYRLMRFKSLLPEWCEIAIGFNSKEIATNWLKEGRQNS